MAQQDEQGFVFRRTCDINPGHQAAATGFARKFVDLYRSKFPEAYVAALNHVFAPYNHVEFVTLHPDLGTFQERTDALAADEAYLRLVGMATAEAFGTCRDELLRPIP